MIRPLRLAGLRLDGFKSFADPVELRFPGAVAAIVGPNGTGKSNIADAVAWVLGERSARLLRSHTMGEAGFSARRPGRPALVTEPVGGFGVLGCRPCGRCGLTRWVRRWGKLAACGASPSRKSVLQLDIRALPRQDG